MIVFIYILAFGIKFVWSLNRDRYGNMAELNSFDISIMNRLYVQ